MGAYYYNIYASRKIAVWKLTRSGNLNVERPLNNGLKCTSSWEKVIVRVLKAHKDKIKQINQGKLPTKVKVSKQQNHRCLIKGRKVNGN